MELMQATKSECIKRMIELETEHGRHFWVTSMDDSNGTYILESSQEFDATNTIDTPLTRKRNMKLIETETIREQIASLNNLIAGLNEDIKLYQSQPGNGLCVLNPEHEAYRLAETRWNLLRQRNELQRKIGH